MQGSIMRQTRSQIRSHPEAKLMLASLPSLRAGTNKRFDRERHYHFKLPSSVQPSLSAVLVNRYERRRFLHLVHLVQTR
jgi:hypothetical protein